jgi:hypothetical protein
MGSSSALWEQDERWLCHSSIFCAVAWGCHGLWFGYQISLPHNVELQVEVWMLTWAPGSGTPIHKDVSEEVFTILKGSGTLYVSPASDALFPGKPQTFPIYPNSTFIIPADSVHQVLWPALTLKLFVAKFWFVSQILNWCNKQFLCCLIMNPQHLTVINLDAHRCSIQWIQGICRYWLPCPSLPWNRKSIASHLFIGACWTARKMYLRSPFPWVSKMNIMILPWNWSFF